VKFALSELTLLTQNFSHSNYGAIGYKENRFGKIKQIKHISWPHEFLSSMSYYQFKTQKIFVILEMYWSIYFTKEFCQLLNY
jgi:hypothetical protein